MQHKISSTFEASNPLVLFEPSESNPKLPELDVGDTLLSIIQAKVLCVRVPFDFKHEATLSHRGVLGSIEPVVEIVQTDEGDPKPGTSQEVKKNVLPASQQEKRGSVVKKRKVGPTGQRSAGARDHQ